MKKRLTEIVALTAFLMVVALGAVRADVVDDRLEEIRYDHINYPYPDPASTDPSTKCSGMTAYALACLYEGQDLTVANGYINYIEDNFSPPDDFVFGDFDGYFEMPLLLRCYMLDECHANLTPSAETDLETMMWKFINKRSLLADAQGTVWTQSGSENHDLVRKTTYLLCAQVLKDSTSYGPNVQLNDGNTILQHYQAWNNYMYEYFRQRAREGLNAEIASPTYQRTTMGCYYNVRDLAEQESLRELAENTIHLFYADTASEFMVKTGIRGGAEIRCYKDNELSLGVMYSMRQWLYGYDWHDYDGGTASHHYTLQMATSDYRVPEIIKAIATDAEKTDYLYTTRRFGQGTTDSSVESVSTITFAENNSSNIRRDTYVSKEYIMGTLTFDQNDSHITVTNQNRMMGVFFANDIDDRIVVHGKGQLSNNKSYADISGVCGKNCMVAARDLNAYSCGSTTRIFISDGQLLDNKEDEDGWIFTHCGPYGSEDRQFVLDDDSLCGGRDNDLLLGLQTSNTSTVEPVLSAAGGGYDAVGRSLVFDGGDTAHTTTGWKSQDSVYVDIWFYLDRVDMANQVLVTATSVWQLTVNNATLSFTVWTTGTPSVATLSGVTLTANTWYNATASVNTGGVVTVAIGANSATVNGSPMVQQDKTLTFGNKTGTARYLYGRLDEAKISLDGTDDTMLGYWKMEDAVSKDSYCGIKIANSGYTVSQAAEDLLYGNMLELSDPWSPVIVQMGRGCDYDGFDDFKTSVKANTINYTSGKLVYISEDNDTYEYYSNSANMPVINHQIVELNPYKTYDSPYLSALHGSDQVTVSYPGHDDLVLDFDYSGAVQHDDYQTIALWHNDSTSGGYVIDDDLENAGRDNNLLISGATLTTGSAGRFGECLDFDGTNDQAYLSNLWESYRAVKVDFWMKSEDTASTANQTIVNATSTWQVHQIGDDLSFVVYTNGDARTLTFENILVQNTWQHVSASIDEFGKMVFKVDEQVLESEGLTLKQQLKPVYLGNKQSYTRWFNGKLDEIKITVPLADYPAAYDDADTISLWHMDVLDGSGNIADDDSADPQRNADLVLSGAVLTADESGHISKALVFDGVDDQAYVTTLWQSYPNVRVEFWMNSDVDDDYANQTIVNATSTWQVHLIENDLTFLVYGTTANTTLTMENCIEAGKWHHIVAWVDNDGYAALVVDGKRIDGFGEPLKQQAKAVYLGNKQTQARWFDGMLDDVKISSF